LISPVCAPPLATAILVATPPPVLNSELVALVSPVADAASEYPVPGAETLIPLNVAAPAMALTVSVPPSVALVGFVAKASVTAPVNDGVALPCESCAFTTIAGVIAAFAVAPAG
jgi:hypothetical protein